MTRPRIGISMDTGEPDEKRRTLELIADYPNAVLRAGGLPLLLPPTHDAAARQEMLSLVQALIIPGGADCDPKLYGQELRPTTHLMDRERQDFDLALLALAEQRRMPTLGICLGCQLMNVARGGTLFQSLIEQMPPNGIMHARPLKRFPPGSAAHTVTVRPGYHLANIYGTPEVAVNSRHSQGIDRIGRGLTATATAPDGLTEALEDPTFSFWVAVQWHPENMVDTPHARLFGALVEAARRRPGAETSAA